MAVVVIGGLLSSTLLAIFVTPALYTLLDDLQNLIIRPKRPVFVPSERVPVDAPTPVPAPVPVPAGAMAMHADGNAQAGNGQGNGTNGHGNGANGHSGSNGHKAEPAWLQKLKAGSFED